MSPSQISQLFSLVGTNPFFTVAVPIILTLLYALWRYDQSMRQMDKRIDQMDKRIDELGEHLRQELRTGFAEINRRLDEMMKKLEKIDVIQDDHEKRVTRIEARYWNK